MKLTIRLLLCLLCTPAFCQEYPPPPFQTVVDYSNPTGTGMIEAFGGSGDGGFNTTSITSQDNILTAAGLKEIRLDYLLANYPRTSTTDTAYLNALIAGCQPYSLCDPNTWNWNNLNSLALSYETTSKLLRMAVVDYGLSWNATTAYNANCAATICPPSDYVTYVDVAKKVYQHLPRPTRVEIWNQPDITATYLPPSAYAQHYLKVATGIRSLDSTIPIGGPATSDPSTTDAYLDALHAAVPNNLINFISFQNFNINPVENTAVASYAHAYWPGIPIFVSEWNATTATEGGDGYDSVAWFGERLLTQFANGYGGEFFSTNPLAGSYYPILLQTGQLLAKAFVWRMLSKTLGLGSGSVPLYNTTYTCFKTKFSTNNSCFHDQLDNEFAIGTANSKGNPILLIAWFWSFPQSINVLFTHVPYGGTPLVTTYLVDHNGHLGQTPISRQRIPVSRAGYPQQYPVVSATVTATPYSVLGIEVTP